MKSPIKTAFQYLIGNANASTQTQTQINFTAALKDHENADMDAKIHFLCSKQTAIDAQNAGMETQLLDMLANMPDEEKTFILTQIYSNPLVENVPNNATRLADILAPLLPIQRTIALDQNEFLFDNLLKHAPERLKKFVDPQTQASINDFMASRKPKPAQATLGFK